MATNAEQITISKIEHTHLKYCETLLKLEREYNTLMQEEHTILRVQLILLKNTFNKDFEELQQKVEKLEN